MTLLHVIRPGGDVETEEYEGPLEFAAPPFTELRRRIMGNVYDPHLELEHVTVLWQGRCCHMFVDENGLARGLEANPKATRVYANGWVSHLDFQDLIYNDLAVEPSLAELESAGFPNLIVGTAALWEGNLE